MPTDHLFVITGASRGFGRALALELLNKYPNGYFLLLASRISDQLTSLDQTFQSKSAKVHVEALDFSQSPERVHSRSTEILNSFINVFDADGERKSAAVTLINNAGSLGALKPFSDLTPKEISEALNMNLISGFACFTSAVLQLKKLHVARDWKFQLVNISSLAAVKPFEHWSLYCAGKAARDMLFKCIAKEDSDIRVLNYAPGPLDTDMQREIRETMPGCSLKDAFIDMHREQKLVKVETSAAKLVRLLQDNTYENGSHIDFYDI